MKCDGMTKIQKEILASNRENENFTIKKHFVVRKFGQCIFYSDVNDVLVSA